MSADHVILCGDAKVSSRARRWKTATSRRLRMGKGARDVHLDIEAIPKRLAAHLPEVAVDLVEIASFVYAADGACRRGGNREFEYGTKWRRYFRFEVPVRRPDIWNRADTRDLLTETLTFLSDDDYEFHFCQLEQSAPMEQYLPLAAGDDQPGAVEEVLLFSGGLDSFSGAVREVFAGQRRIALVSHVSTEKVGKPQRDLAAELAALAPKASLQPLHVPIGLNKGKALGVEHSQRTRSFVYATLGGVVARMLGLSRLRFYENGIISFNLPTSLQVLGGRASRTTHPRSLASLARLLSLLFESEFQIENPFLWKTKTEILRELKASGHASLCAKTISCARTIERTTQHSHCGRCSQCVDRRLVALAAGLDDSEDPAIMYDAKLDTPRDDALDRTMVERYIGAALRVRAMPDAASFMREYGEVARALRHLGMDADRALRETFDLHQRHANQVRDALVTLVQANAHRFIDRDIPPTSLIGIVAGLSQELGISAPKAGASPSTCATQDETVDLSFRIDEGTFEVWNGGKPCSLGNTMEFRALRRLARRPGHYVSVQSLVDDAWGGAIRTNGAIQKTISNLRRKLREAGVEGIELDGAQRGHYALKISARGKE